MRGKETTRTRSDFQPLGKTFYPHELHPERHPHPRNPGYRRSVRGSLIPLTSILEKSRVIGSRRKDAPEKAVDHSIHTIGEIVEEKGLAVISLEGPEEDFSSGVDTFYFTLSDLQNSRPNKKESQEVVITDFNPAIGETVEYVIDEETAEQPRKITSTERSLIQFARRVFGWRRR